VNKFRKSFPLGNHIATTTAVQSISTMNSLKSRVAWTREGRVARRSLERRCRVRRRRVVADAVTGL